MWWYAAPAGRKDTGKAVFQHCLSWEWETRRGGSTALGAASSAGFLVPPSSLPAAGRRHVGAAAGTLTLQIMCLWGDPSGREQREVRAGTSGSLELGTALPCPCPSCSEQRPHTAQHCSPAPQCHTHTHTEVPAGSPAPAHGPSSSTTSAGGGQRAPCPALSRNPGTSAPRAPQRRREDAESHASSPAPQSLRGLRGGSTEAPHCTKPTAANRHRHPTRRARMGRDAAARPHPAAPWESCRLGKDPTHPTWGCGSSATHPEPEHGLGLETRETHFPLSEASGWMGAVSCG